MLLLCVSAKSFFYLYKENLTQALLAELTDAEVAAIEEAGAKGPPTPGLIARRGIHLLLLGAIIFLAVRHMNLL